MRWLIVDARRRYAALLIVAVAAAVILGWTAWSGMRATRAGALRPIRYGDSVQHRVALTFDIGHGATQVAAVLAELKASRVRATFFVTEQWARENRELLRQISLSGHTVEASGREYADMSRLGREQAASDLSLVADAISSITGERPRFFRPPAGRCSDDLLEAAITEALIPVTWTIDSQDWRVDNAAAIVRRVSACARPGAIILFNAGDSGSHTAPALQDLIALLRKAGLEPVTLRELLADEDGN